MGADGFSEDSKSASEIAFCYGKLREAELQTNTWTFAIRSCALRAVDDNTMLLDAALYSEAVTYFVGSIVADQYANLWISRIPNNLANDPLAVATSYWEPYFGPIAVALYDSGQSYSAGELVYTTAGDGTARIYQSLQSGNEDVPGTATAYDATAVYQKNDVVTSASIPYMSLINLNTGNTPASSAAAWDSGITYGAGDAAMGSDGIRYTSVAGGNLGNDPTLTSPASWTDTGVLVPWTTVFVGGTGSVKWRQIGGAEFPNGVGLKTLDILYPLGTGPSTQNDTRNIFMLPFGFLREAPQNPKAVPVSWLGGPSGITYNDWVFNDGYLITTDIGVIIFRFVANVTDVSRMHAMFCEALAARVAFEVCEPLTQSSAKKGVIARTYDEWVEKARLRNSIEQGYDDPPEDTYISCRQ